MAHKSPIILSPYDDVFIDTPKDHPNTIYALAGNDEISGNGGSDEIYGGDGNDTIYGETREHIEPIVRSLRSPESDVLDPVNVDDRLHGGAGLDTLEGGAGRDVLYG